AEKPAAGIAARAAAPTPASISPVTDGNRIMALRQAFECFIMHLLIGRNLSRIGSRHRVLLTDCPGNQLPSPRDHNERVDHVGNYMWPKSRIARKSGSMLSQSILTIGYRFFAVFFSRGFGRSCGPRIPPGLVPTSPTPEYRSNPFARRTPREEPRCI